MPPTPPAGVDKAAPVGLDEPADQWLGPSLGEPLLPICEPNAASVLWARTVLWKETWPRTRVGVDLETVTGLTQPAHLTAGHRRLDGPLAFPDDVRILHVESHAELMNRSGVTRDRTIPEIETEEM